MTPREYLVETGLPVVMTEGEKKPLALERIAWEVAGDAEDWPAFLPVGLSGVNSWKGKVGQTPAENRGTVDVYGTVPDIDLITWRSRRVTILFDANAATNDSVAWARYRLARELQDRGACVLISELPQEDGK